MSRRSFVPKVDCILSYFASKCTKGLPKLLSCTVLNTKLTLRGNKRGLFCYEV